MSATTQIEEAHGTTFVTDEGLTVARVWKQGDWYCKVWFGPEESVTLSRATRESAMFAAKRHAAKFA